MQDKDKACTDAKTNGEAKQAFETMGMGVETTALSVKSAGKSLEKVSEAGVESAQISENSGAYRKPYRCLNLFRNA